MKVLIDMNLSPDWVDVLTTQKIEAIHWTKVGSATAPDKEIMAWAKAGGYIILTHDLDFGAILAATEADSPSVIQLRVQDIAPDRARNIMLDVLSRFKEELRNGVLISVDEDRARIRILPIM